MTDCAVARQVNTEGVEYQVFVDAVAGADQAGAERSREGADA
ncbi:MAG: hypothetical protein R3B46_02545 [Phycisphaerales bacterium]